MSQGLQALARQRQMGAPLVVGHGVDLVDDDGLNIMQDRAAALRGEENVERFRRGDENVRWPLQHGAALVHQGVAGADRGPNLGHEQAALARQLQNFAEWDLEVFLYVVAQRLERGDIQHFGAVAQIAGQRLAHETVNAGQEGGERLARAGRGGDERGSPGQDVRPALLLRLSRGAELLDEPLRYERMSPSERGGEKHSSILAAGAGFANRSPRRLSRRRPWIVSLRLWRSCDRPRWSLPTATSKSSGAIFRSCGSPIPNPPTARMLESRQCPKPHLPNHAPRRSNSFSSTSTAFSPMARFTSFLSPGEAARRSRPWSQPRASTPTMARPFRWPGGEESGPGSSRGATPRQSLFGRVTSSWMWCIRAFGTS